MPIWMKYLIEGGTGAAILRGAWYAFMQWQKWQHEKKAVAQLNGVDAIGVALVELVAKTPCDYAQVVHVHNGGRPLSAGMPIFMTVRHEKVAYGFFPLKDNIQSIPIDEHYRQMVARLIKVKDGWADIEKEDDKTLNIIWKKMKAKYARSAIIGVNKTGVYFLRTTSSTKPLDEQHTLEFKRCLSTLKKFYP